MLWDKLKDSTENDYIDFKMKWYEGESSNIDMIQDILCLSNSLTDSNTRYLVIGVKEHKISKEKTFHDISNDKNHRTSEDIIQLLRNYMTVIPNIEIIRETINNNSIDIICITPNFRDLPYVLNKNMEYKYISNNKEKQKILFKNGVYSRDGSSNTPKNELCSKVTLEELYARKRGEHLPILSRFSNYLDNIKDWKHPHAISGVSISEDSYFYTKNHKFKIVRNEPLNDSHKSIYSVIDYYQLLMDTSIGENYWKYRTDGAGACYDDYYYTFSVELWADNTLIEVYEMVYIYLKHYNYDKYRQGFYIPDRSCILRDKDNIKNQYEYEQTIEWKIAKLLFEFDQYSESVYKNKDASIILDELNYDYLSKPNGYLSKNNEFLFQPANKILKN